MQVDSRLANLVQQAQQLATIVEAEEASLKNHNAQLRKILEQQIPELMDELEYERIDTPEYSLTVNDVLTASVPKHKRDEVCSWLIDNDLGSLVSYNVVVALKPGQEQEVIAVTDELTNAGYSKYTSLNKAVNTGSLKKAVRELLAEGEDVPLDLLGVFNVRKAIIKRT